MSAENLPERLPIRRSPKEIILQVLQSQHAQRPVNMELTRLFKPIRKVAQEQKT